MAQTKEQSQRWHREYAKKHRDKIQRNMAAYNRRKRRFIAAFKNKPCADCGGWFHPVQMDFDHRPTEQKLFSLSQPRIRKMEILYREMQKCDLVCANCHRLRTYRRNQHGASTNVLLHRESDRNQLSVGAVTD